MSRVFKLSILGLSAALLLFIFAGTFRGLHLHAQEDSGAYKQIEVYNEVLLHVQNDYVTEPNISQVTTGALHGLLESLDADSSYLTPTEYIAYKQFAKAGNAQVGLVMSKRFGYATVVTVLHNSPAEKAEIQDGDVIESINDRSTREMSVATIRGLLEGQPGSQVTLSVIKPRKLDPDKVVLTRTTVGVPAFTDQQYDANTILYIKPGAITPERVKDAETRLKAMPKDGNTKVLLDLRDTAEGDDQQAIALANFFLKSGTIATLEGQKYPKQTFTADAAKQIVSGPVAVLVNHGTSGPAEIVAEAILGNKRGDVVGDRTFGEGSVQKLMELPDGGAVILSVAKYKGPDGKAIEDEAVTPNVEVTSADETASQAIDENPGVDTSNAPVEKTPKTDDQLNKALSVLKTKTA